MASTPNAPQPGIEWSAQQLRATIFHAPGDIGSGIHEFWTKAFGTMPQQDETRNLEGVRMVGGQVGDRQWVVNIRPERVDIILQPANIPPPGSGDVWNRFEKPYRQVAQELNEPNRLVVDMVPSIHRLAVGALFLAPAPGLSETYAKLGIALPNLRLDGLDAPDFSFRINRRRQSQRSPGLWVNRLATWSIAQGQAVSFGLVGSGGASAAGSEIQLAASLQLDINTAQVGTGRRMPTDKAKDILAELVEMATEIAEKGDVP